MNELTVKNQPKIFSIVPKTLDEALKFAEMIAQSSLCPNNYKGKTGDVIIAMQMGADVGLSPMQAIQNIAVINGRPSLWGDVVIALVRAHPKCESVREWIEGSLDEGNAIAYCAIKRKGQKEEIKEFSIVDAIRAGLWKKTGPWSQYPKRMLQMRARGFAARDVFPDALKGLSIAEEAQDYPNEKIIGHTEASSNKLKGVEALKEKLGIKKNVDILDEPSDCESDERLGLISNIKVIDEKTVELVEAEPIEAYDSEIIKWQIKESQSLSELKEIAERVKNSDTLSEKEKNIIRELYKAKEKTLKESK